ncbi:hypothetical protein GUJ93_ZPchr0008g13066 [Zizania palustris]|uniref:Strictosidine synthase conserved region domain-containing protein n=1 Tax=Zizania palustris TaxID=103762 RepID=A0A8J5RKD8_ZIZPA|nr:hypothetical protein GUJ93_ZPchr0008g13066 [Zizania palustris]
MGLCELRRYWVRDPKAGKSETFAEVPGFPDNVRRADGYYWVALSREADGDDPPPTRWRCGSTPRTGPWRRRWRCSAS